MYQMTLSLNGIQLAVNNQTHWKLHVRGHNPQSSDWLRTGDTWSGRQGATHGQFDVSIHTLQNKSPSVLFLFNLEFRSLFYMFFI